MAPSSPEYGPVHLHLSPGFGLKTNCRFQINSRFELREVVAHQPDAVLVPQTPDLPINHGCGDPVWAGSLNPFFD